jgi:hypothetical protein
MRNKIIIIVLGLLVAWCLISEIRYIFVPSELGNPEGAIIYNSRFLIEHRPLYRDWRHLPYVITPYTPLYYVMVGMAVWVLNLTAIQTYVAARMITFGCTLAVAGEIYVLARLIKSTKTGSVIGAGIFLLNPFLVPWAFVSRPDMAMLAVALWGMILAMRKKYVTAVILMAAAFLIKQTAIAPILALAFVRPRREVLIWGGMILGISGLLDLVSHGYFWLNIVGANIYHQINFSLFPLIFLNLAFQLIIFLPVVIYFYKFGFRKNIMVIYVLIAGLIGMISAVKPGADVNYFLEFIAGSCVIFAKIAGDFLNTKHSFAAWFLTGLLIMNYSDARSSSRARIEIKPTDNLKIETEKIKGEILSDYLYFNFDREQKIYLTDGYNLSLLENQNWNPGELVELIRRQKFEEIVLTFDVKNVPKWGGVPRWPKSLTEAVLDRYKLKRIFGDKFFIYQRIDKNSV